MRTWLCMTVVLIGCGASDERAYTELDSGAGGTGGSAQGGAAGIGGHAGASGSGGLAGQGGAAGQAGVGGAAGSSCQLGTPDHCGACEQPCPGVDNAGTQRVCSDDTPAATCDILCLGDHYDLDGNPATGCEALDEPDQSSASTAVAITLPDTNDPSAQSNPLNLSAHAYGDDREHDPAPVQRPFGTPDWWAVTAVGEGDPDSAMVACLGIVNFPADTRIELCLSDIGEESFDPSACTLAEGSGPSVCVAPPAGTDAGGPYYVRVQQLEGTRSPNGYALFLKH